MAPSVGEGEVLERGEDLFGPAGRGAVAVAPGDVDVGDGVERLLLLLARDVGHDHRRSLAVSDSTIAAVAAQPDSSHTNRCQSTAAAGTTLPRGPTAAIEDPSGASEAHRAPGASPCTTRSRSTVPAAGSARRMV